MRRIWTDCGSCWVCRVYRAQALQRQLDPQAEALGEAVKIVGLAYVYDGVPQIFKFIIGQPLGGGLDGGVCRFDGLGFCL